MAGGDMVGSGAFGAGGRDGARRGQTAARLASLACAAMLAAGCEVAAGDGEPAPTCTPGTQVVLVTHDVVGNDWFHLTAHDGPAMAERTLAFDAPVPAGRWDVTIDVWDPGPEAPDTPDERVSVTVGGSTVGPSTDIPAGVIDPAPELLGQIELVEPADEVTFTHVGEDDWWLPITDSVYIRSLLLSCADGGLSGTFSALAYNVAGLPDVLSGSNPEVNMPQIGPRLDAYDLVLLQESWKTPDPNPNPDLRVYHEILEATVGLPYASESAVNPFNSDPRRPTALLADGLNRFSTLRFDSVERNMWSGCYGIADGASDCLSQKGFSVAIHELAPGVELLAYNLHMEAGGGPEDLFWSRQNVLQLAEHVNANANGRPVVIGGDFNLHSENGAEDEESFDIFLELTGVIDVCAELGCPDPGRIDKWVYLDGDTVDLTPLEWRNDDPLFEDADGVDLSDHEPIAVDWAWTATP